MSVPLHPGPIIACSTGIQFNCAIALIRLSGFDSIEGLRAFTTLSAPIEPLRAYPTKVINPKTQEILDHIVMTYFEGPRSYTGEHILELSVHGNALNVQRIIKVFCDEAGFFMAYPGEFTYRALVNKKLSLPEVEGLDLLLNASSEFALKQSMEILGGEVNRAFLKLKETFTAFRASVELFIDFSEDVGEEEAMDHMEKSFQQCLAVVKKLTLRVGHGEGLFSPCVSLVGRPNSGKSTLFNALLGERRSIVSEQEGTTRDYVSEFINYRGVRYRLTDTAGLREVSRDLLEREGMERVSGVLKKSFFKILIFNPHYRGKETPIEALEETEFDLLIVTHTDKGAEGVAPRGVGRELSAKKVLWTGLSQGMVKVFAPIEPYRGQLVAPMGAEEPFDFSKRPFGGEILGDVHQKFEEMASKNPFLVQRHSILIEQIHHDLESLGNLLRSQRDVGILSSEISIVGHKIHELVGLVSPEEVLSSLFSNFCIGK